MQVDSMIMTGSAAAAERSRRADELEALIHDDLLLAKITGQVGDVPAHPPVAAFNAFIPS